MDTNLISRIHQAGRNTVRRTDWERIPPQRRIENFLTEAMALATVADPQPIVAALAQAGALSRSPGIERVDVATQQRVFGVTSEGNKGRDLVAVDLVLSLVRADLSREEVWVEVKAGAGLHGTQINNYLWAIKQAKDPTNRKLVLLDHADVAQRTAAAFEGVTPLSWHDLSVCALESESRIWRDFAGFLRANGLVAVGPAAALLAGGTADVAQALSVALAQAPGSLEATSGPSGWARWTKGRSEYMRLKTLQSSLLASGPTQGDVGEVIVWAPAGFTQLRLGLYEHPQPSLGVKLATSRWYPVSQSGLRAIVRSATLDEGIWSRPDDRDDDVVAAAIRSIDGGINLQAATSWFLARLRDLQLAGLLVNLDADGGIAAPAPTSG